MESEPGTREFIQEAARRALSNSEQGYVVISDATDGARFSNTAGTNFNSGEYREPPTLRMRAGDRFGFMLVPNQSIEEAAAGRAWGTVFSMATANPDDNFQFGQIADVTGDGNTFTLEDISLAGGRSDRDYNDIIFQVRGATAEAPLMDDVLGVDQDWRNTDIGQALLDYAKAYIEPSEVDFGDLDSFIQVTEVAESLPSGWVDGDVSGVDWAQQLIEQIDTANEAGHQNLVINLSINLTELDEMGNLVPRIELTQQEIDALDYAHKHNVLIVVPAGDQPDTISALGEASLAFDNVITVGSAEKTGNYVSIWKSFDASEYSGSGFALDLVADGSNGEISSTSVAAANVKATIEQMWEENPDLSYREIAQLLQRTATDLKEAGWDWETGVGMLNAGAAVGFAKVKTPLDIDAPLRWLKFEKSKQPLVGIIDTGFNGKNPDIDYSRITLGKDHVDDDDNPLFETGDGNEHGTHVLGIIAATQGNGIGIDGINDDAPIWLGRAVGSGKWAESLREFVDTAKASGQKNAVVNLSFDLTQTNPDGTVTTRYDLTPQEREALEYARQNGVLVVVAAGNDGGTMSALGQASQEFDNLITVGSVDQHGKRTDYSSFGYGLDLVARGGTISNPETSTSSDGADLKTFLEENGDESEEDDEMSLALQEVFDEEFGEFGEFDDAEDEDLELPDDLSDDERQAYEEAIKAIDEALSGYEEEGFQKVGLEFISDYMGVGVESAEAFLDVFNEDAIDNLVKAEEILGDVLENGDSSLRAALEFSSLSDLDVTDEEAEAELTADLLGLDFSVDPDMDMGIGEMAGTSVAAAKVTGAVSQVWAANPDLSYKQIKEILSQTAQDLNKKGWDKETGSGLVNIAAAVALAKETQPEAYDPKEIFSPLIWSGEGEVIPGERSVSVSVPTFTGRVMNAGYVAQTGWLRVRSGPGTNYSQVGLKYPGNSIQFNAYQNNGQWVPDPYMPGGGSSRWYRIAGTNHWMSALYIDNTPERAASEREQLETIRQAEEEARRAEQEARQAEEEARQAEEELRRLEEEARRQAVEAARRQAEQLQAAVAAWSSKIGDFGAATGSFISNGVSVHKYQKGALFIQPDGRSMFYDIEKKVYDSYPYKGLRTRFDELNAIGTVEMGLNKAYSTFSKTGKEPLDFKNWIGNKFIKGADNVNDVIDSHLLNPGGYLKKLETLYPVAKYLPVNQQLDLIGSTHNFFKSGTPEILAKIGKTGTKASEYTGNLLKWLDTPVTKFGGKNAPVVGDVIDIAFTGHDLIYGDEATQRRAQVKTGAMVAGAVIGGAVGSLGFGVAAGPAALGTAFIVGNIVDLAYFGADRLGHGDNVDQFLANSYSAVGNSINSVKSSINDTLKAAREKAAAAKAKATQAVESAKATVIAAKKKVEQAKAAYNTFKQETKKAVTKLVTQSQQKVQAAIQRAKQEIIQRAPRVVKYVARHAGKAVRAVQNVINGAKKFVGGVINKGKQLVSNVLNKGKQAVQAVTNFVSNTYNTAKTVASNTYNYAASKVNQAKSALSNAAKRLKFW